MGKQSWRGRKDQAVDELALLFAAGRDVQARQPADLALLPYDLWNSEAHTIMLWKRRILAKSDLRKILAALEEIRCEWQEGTFWLDPALEDVHMNIEVRLSERVGKDTGGRMHTGRSRNDQVACDMRMFLREELLKLSADAAQLADELVRLAGKHLDTVMPGLTHRRPATVTSAAHWLAAHAQALLRDLERIGFAYRLINRCPLGAAAAYGTSWALDRSLVAKLLGFDSVEENTLDCITHRWESEAQAAVTVAMLLNHCSSLAQDLIVFSMEPARWVRLPDAFTTGSSIMPQKRNPDFAEIILGRSAAAAGAVQTLLGIGRGLPMGYNRETQVGKQTIIELLEDTRLVPQVLARVMAEVDLDGKRLAAAATEGYLNAVDFADHLVRDFSLPFREAYGVVARAIGRSPARGPLSREALNRELKALGVQGSLSAEQHRALCSPESNLARRKHLGGPAPSAVRGHLRRLREGLEAHLDWLGECRGRLEAARSEVDAVRRQLVGSPG